MPLQTTLAQSTQQLASCAAFTCPIQVLVIDRPNGPASILIDTISRLLDRDISVTTLDDHGDALRALAYYDFDLAVVGIQPDHPLQLAVLPHLHHQRPDRPIVVVGHKVPSIYRQQARVYGAREIITLPRTAAELKALLAYLAEIDLLPG